MALVKRIWIDDVSEVATDRDTLSALMRDIDAWADWTPGLLAILRRAGEVRVGSRFVMRLKLGHLPQILLPCQVFQWDVDRIEWGGGIPGSTIRHSMEFMPSEEGRCRLRHMEYATGILALTTLPFAKVAYRHDKAWTDAIVARFAG